MPATLLVRADRASYFRERMTDVRDVIFANRVAPDTQPVGHGDPAGDSRNGDESVILVAHEILPSQAMSLGDLPIAGIVTEVGGSTSHAAILARSRGIPAVSGVDGVMGDVANGDLMIVDGRDGMVILRPDQAATSAFARSSASSSISRTAWSPTATSRPSAPTEPASSCTPTSTTWPMPRPRTR
jgi:phosphotransferase system enzyme I (PtsI)